MAGWMCANIPSLKSGANALLQNCNRWVEVVLWGGGHRRNQCCSQGQEAMEDPEARGHHIKLTEYKVWLNGSEMLG